LPLKELNLAEYTVEMFQVDFDKVLPLLFKFRDLESLEEKTSEVKPEDAFMEIVSQFVEKYGNQKGTDYQVRFLSIMQFLEHYSKDLLKDNLISETQDTSAHVPVQLLSLLLDSFKSPQPPNPYPSSSLHNQYHEFNYKKVLKAFKSGKR
jgi:hypothetical protein